MFLSQAHTLATGKPSVVPASADKVIPAGACVVTDQVSYPLMANRFTSDVPGCAQIVDGLGTDLDLSNGRNGVTGAGNNPAVAALWMNAFRHAQYIWFSSAINGISDRRIAWNPALRAYFKANFRQVKQHDRIYQRVGGGVDHQGQPVVPGTRSSPRGPLAGLQFQVGGVAVMPVGDESLLGGQVGGDGGQLVRSRDGPHPVACRRASVRPIKHGVLGDHVDQRRGGRHGGVQHARGGRA
jgi:hypothetical protein